MSHPAGYRLCARCVMDTSDPDISFDHDGFCNHCSSTSRLSYQREESRKHLTEVVERLKTAGAAGEYDCVVGISGGVDSCYAAYVAKSLGLRPLAVHMDNGWDSDIAVKNIKNVVGRLGIDYSSYVLDWDEFKDLQLSFLKASVPEIESPTDMAIQGALHRVAAEHNIKFIISGGNYATEGILPKAWHYDAKDIKYLKGIHAMFGKKRLKTFPTFGHWDETFFKLIKGIKLLYLLNYRPYSRNAAVKILQEELGWQDYKGKHNESKITKFVQSYVLPVKFNIDYRRATLSNRICARDVSREQALEELEKTPFNPDEVDAEKDYLAKKLGLQREELDVILARPPKSFRNYANNQRFLEVLYESYRKVSRPLSAGAFVAFMGG